MCFLCFVCFVFCVFCTGDIFLMHDINMPRNAEQQLWGLNPVLRSSVYDDILQYFQVYDDWRDFVDYTQGDDNVDCTPWTELLKSISTPNYIPPHFESLLKGLDQTCLPSPLFACCKIWVDGYLGELARRLEFIYENGLPEYVVKNTTDRLPYKADPELRLSQMPPEKKRKRRNVNTIQHHLSQNKLSDDTPIWVYSNPLQSACDVQVGGVLTEPDRGIFTHTNPFWVFWISPKLKCRLDIKITEKDIAYVVPNLSIKFTTQSGDVTYLKTVILKPSLSFVVEEKMYVPLPFLCYNENLLQAHENYKTNMECLICRVAEA